MQTVDVDNPWIVLLKVWICACANNPWIACSIFRSHKMKGTEDGFRQSSNTDVRHTVGCLNKQELVAGMKKSNRLSLQNHTTFFSDRKVYCLKDESSFKLVQTVAPSEIQVQHNLMSLQRRCPQSAKFSFSFMCDHTQFHMANLIYNNNNNCY